MDMNNKYERWLLSMIAKFINDLVSFFGTVLNLIVLLYFLRVVLDFCFGFKFLKFRKVSFGKRLRLPNYRNEGYYEFKRFKVEQRHQYKLEKYKMRLSLKQDRRKSSLIASIPRYLKIVK